MPMIFQRKNKGRKASPRGAGNEDRQGKVGGGHCGCAQAHKPIGPGGDSAKRRGGCDGRNPGPSTLLTSPTQKELRRAIAGEINFRQKVESRKANPGPSMLLTSPTLKELRRAVAGPINSLLVKLLPTELFLLIGGELRIFSQLQISETDRSVCQYVLSVDVREKRYKSESNQARYGDRGIP